MQKTLKNNIYIYSLVRSSVRLHGNILQFHLFLPPEDTQPLPPMVDMSMVNTDMVDTDMVDTERSMFYRGDHFSEVHVHHSNLSRLSFAQWNVVWLNNKPKF